MIKRVLVPLAALTSAVTAFVLPAVDAAASTPPVVYGLPNGAIKAPWFNYVNPQVRPTSAIAARNTVTLVADGEWIVFRNWSSWTSAGAVGSGTLYVRKLGGGATRSSPASIRFYRVERHGRQPYFTRLRFTLKHRVYAQGSSTANFSPRFAPAWIKQG